MTVRELIESLQQYPPEMDVCLWNEGEDEYLPVAMTLWEQGHSSVDLLTEPEAAGYVKNLTNSRED